MQYDLLLILLCKIETPAQIYESDDEFLKFNLIFSTVE